MCVLLLAGVVQPVGAVGHAVGDEILTGVCDGSGHEIRNEEMAGAGAALVLSIKPAIVASAVPAAVHWRGMQTGPAVYGRSITSVAGRMVRAHPALEPGRIVADPRRVSPVRCM